MSEAEKVEPGHAKVSDDVTQRPYRPNKNTSR